MIDPNVREWVNIQNRQCALNERDAGTLGYQRIQAFAELDAPHARRVHYTADCGRVGPGALADASMNERGVIVAAYCTGSPHWSYFESTEATPVVDDAVV